MLIATTGNARGWNNKHLHCQPLLGGFGVAKPKTLEAANFLKDMATELGLSKVSEYHS